PGDRIPLDGIVTEGESRIDTSPVTGEPVPVTVRRGSRLMSGCVNEQGVLQMRVEKPLSESMVTKILDSVENAAASKPKLDRFITRFARIYTPIVVLAAVATAIIPSLVTGNWREWIYTAITFLVISCPCALVLSVPLAFFSGIGAGSKKGILFKGGIAIEALKNVKAVVMDKTGTITRGEFQVQSVIPFGRESMDGLLQLAAQCELGSTHPIGTSIVEAAREKGMTLERPEKVEEISGKGIHAVTERGEVLCGNRALMELFHVRMDRCGSVRYGTEVLLALDGELAGCIVIADSLKKEAKDAIAMMKKQGLVTAMFTGDGEESARAVAGEAGIDRVYARLLPQDKLTRLQEMRREAGAVMFVGDGINDAPVLAGADVGAAMGSGADAAIEAADVVFMTSQVTAVPESVAIARKTGRIAMQNVVFALTVKALVMILGFAGMANMWMAVFADTGVAMLCVLNSIRALYGKAVLQKY
ncbi:MAG TPA: cadmium-translocating P-type ATPase, partial [Candidatus Dorea stercoravium]|nr:cadmium-translocating P-type ATPase [Candidatus Dorea stercoravium]